MKRKPKIELRRSRKNNTILVNNEILHRLDRIHEYKVFAGGKKIAFFYTLCGTRRFMVTTLEEGETHNSVKGADQYHTLKPQPKNIKSTEIIISHDRQKAFLKYKDSRGRYHLFSFDSIGPFEEKMAFVIIADL